MIKNIVLDIGGVILNFSNDVLMNFLNRTRREIKELTKMIYGDKRWNECLLGYLTQNEYMEQLINEVPKYKTDIEKMLLPDYQENVLPLMKETLKVMYELKNKDYKIYFLSNLTEATYDYMKEKLNILDNFDGGVYSWEEHLIKPNEEIYELLIKRYRLIKEETIFFDDTLKNIEVGNKIGIKSIQFKTITDIKSEI